MNPLLLLGLAVLAAGLGLVLHRPALPSPHREAEARDVAALPPELRRQMERYIEQRAGRGAATVGQLALVLLAALLGAVALLFPFFKLAAVIPAVVTALIVAQFYLQAQETKRRAALDKQALTLLRRAVANLSGTSNVSPARLVGNLLLRAGEPLGQEVAAILPPLQGGQNFLPALEDVMETTRSARLRRVLHLWRASEEERLGPAGQAARFRALAAQEKLLERLTRKTKLSVKKAQGSMYVVIGIIPALVAVMMAMVPEFRNAYMHNLLGQFGLAMILGLEFLVVWISRRIIAAALQ